MKHQAINRLILVGLIGFFASCASSYQPYGITGGYEDRMVSRRLVQVEFKGNGATDAEQASEFCLRRAAEVALGQGYAYFVLTQSHLNEKVFLLGHWDRASLERSRQERQHQNLVDQTYYWGILPIPLAPKATLTARLYEKPPEVPEGPLFEAKLVVRLLSEAESKDILCPGTMCLPDTSSKSETTSPAAASTPAP